METWVSELLARPNQNSLAFPSEDGGMGRQRSYDSADELSGGRFGNDIERQEIEQRRHKMNSVKAKQDALRRRQHDAAVKKKQLQAVERGMKGGYQKMESPSVFVGTGS